MTADIDRIIPEVGLESLHFGVSIAEAHAVLGEPSATTRDDEGNTVLDYPDLGLSLTFWGDFSDRLGYITTRRETAELCGRRLHGRSEDEARAFLRTQLGVDVSESDIIVHEDGSEQTYLDSDPGELTLWFSDGRLSSIDWTCTWHDAENPAWSALADRPTGRCN